MIFGGLKIFAVLGIAGAALVWSRPDLVAQIFPPCRTPIRYSIGSFDERFGISESEFLAAIFEAEALWEKAIGKELFAYEPGSGRLGVNLVFDERQETTQELDNIEDTVEAKEASYKTIRSTYEAAKARYDIAESSYDTRVEAFNRKNDAYGARVDSWNAGPRTSRSELAAIEAERNAIEAEFEALKREEESLNAAGRELNRLIDQLNAAADTLNTEVSRYNAAGASRGDTFTGGTYTESGWERSINIYEFSSKPKLVRVLAHELGHSLGLEHTIETGSVMYHLNEGEALKLSSADIEAVKELCRIE